MAAPSPTQVFDFVLYKVADYAGYVPGEDDDNLLDADLHIEGWDFIDLCEDLERTYDIDLKSFFEKGQPVRGWFIWKRKIAKDVTALELANYVIELVGRQPGMSA